MDLLLLLIATLLSTTAMTLFSYAVSAAFRDLYKEPVLLDYLMHRYRIRIGEREKTVAAWLLHYFLGLVFVIGYLIPLQLGYYRNSWVSGIVFGILIGLIGIVGWKIMFRLAGRTPIANPTLYYVQLFLAHIVFGLTTVVSFYITEAINF